MLRRGNNDRDIAVTVIDSIMGTGKTSYAIQMMNEADVNTHFIYVTPFLDEVNRIKTYVTGRDFKEPTIGHGEASKMRSLKKLISEGADIATTHALFSMADDELMDLLEWGNYVLIIDEVLEVIKQIPTKKNDVELLLEAGWVEIDSNNRVIWIAGEEKDSKYNNLKTYALTGNLYSYNNMAFIWQYPVKMFKRFEKIYILTYMFDGQIQKYYYDLHNVSYDYFGVIKSGDSRYCLIPKSDIFEDRAYFKNLINIYEGKLNDVGGVRGKKG